MRSSPCAVSGCKDKEIAMRVGVSPATVSRVLKRAGLSRMKDLEPAEPVCRYEYADPGGLIHIDIKKLGGFDRIGHHITGDRKGQSTGRGVSWEFVHVRSDDASRIAFTQIKPDEKAVNATAFLKAAVAYYFGLGVRSPASWPTMDHAPNPTPSRAHAGG